MVFFGQKFVELTLQNEQIFFLMFSGYSILNLPSRQIQRRLRVEMLSELALRNEHIFLVIFSTCLFQNLPSRTCQCR